MKKQLLTLTLGLLAALVSAQSLDNLWSQEIGSGKSESSQPVNAIEDALGNIYVVGRYEGSVHFDSKNGLENLSNPYTTDNAFFCKYDSNLNLIWVKEIVSDNTARIEDIAVNSKGELFLCMTLRGSSDLDPGLDEVVHATGHTSILQGVIGKYNSEGEYVDHWEYKASGNSLIYSLEINSKDEIILNGDFFGELDFDFNSTINYKIKADTAGPRFVATYTPKMKLKWIYTMPKSPISSWHAKLILGKNDEIFYQTVVRDSFRINSKSAYQKASGLDDFFIMKLDSAGNPLWYNKIECDQFDNVFEISVLPSGALILVGYFRKKAIVKYGNSTIDTIYSEKKGTTGFITKVNRNGQFDWFRTIESTGNNFTYGLAYTGNNNICVSGYFNDSVFFTDPVSSQSLNGNLSSYLANYDTSGYIKRVTPFQKTNINDGFTPVKIRNHNSQSITLIALLFRGADFDPDPKKERIVKSKKSRFGRETVIARYRVKDHSFIDEVHSVDLYGENEVINDHYTDNRGHTYTVGSFSGIISLKPLNSSQLFLNSKGEEDGFVCKYDSFGNLLWVYQIGGSGTDAVNTIRVDKEGDVIIGGFFSDSIFIDSARTDTLFSTRSNSVDGFVAKLSATGNYKWSKTLESNYNVKVKGLGITKSNDIAVCGYYEYEIMFDTFSVKHLTGNSGSDGFLALYNDTGYVEWTLALDGNNQDTAINIAIDNSSNIYIAGGFEQNIKLRPKGKKYELSSNGQRDIFLAQFDTTGLAQWGINVGGSSNDYFGDMKIDDGFIYLTGQFDGQGNFGRKISSRNALTANGGKDGFIGKYNLNGFKVWAYGLGGKDDNDIISGVAPNGEAVFITGGFKNTVDFGLASSGQKITSQGKQEFFISKLDSAANTDTTVRFKGSRTSIAKATNLSQFRNSAYVSGVFNDVIELGTVGLGNEKVFRSQLSQDIFFAKFGTLDSCAPKVSYGIPIDTFVCDSFIAPSGKAFYKSGHFVDRIANNEGCDSVFAIDLRILKNTGYSKRKSCKPVLSPSGNFYLDKTGIYTDTLTNKFGCDSIITIDFTNNTTYNSAKISKCFSYRLPSKSRIVYSSGSYTDTTINQFGCNNILTIDVDILPSPRDTNKVISCGSFVSPSGKTLTKSGVYTDSFKNALGCDSIIVTKLTIPNNGITKLLLHACDSFRIPNSSKIIYSSGTYLDTVKGSLGCDSILEYAITINKTSSQSLQKTSCDSFIWNGRSLVKTGSYSDSLISKGGCDSILQLDLSINYSSRASISIKDCDYFFVPSGNRTITSSGTYLDTIKNVAGCDSIISIEAEIFQSSVTAISAVSCNTYLLPSGSQTVKKSGVFFDTLVTINGCDSVLEIDLRLTKISKDVTVVGNTIKVLQDSITYQWLDCNANFSAIANEVSQSFTPKNSGNFAAELTKENCIDTTACNYVIGTRLSEHEASSFKVFPNPTSGVLILQVDALIKYEIYDMNGKMVLEGTNGQQINVSSLASGEYFIKATTNQQVFESVFVKE